MVSGDTIQRFEGTLKEPEVRVWIHPPKGITRTDEITDDKYVILGDESDPVDGRIKHGYEYINEQPIAETTPLIAYDGYEFQPFEFDQYTDAYTVSDEQKRDIGDIHDQYPKHPDAADIDDPYRQVLTPGAFFDIHEGGNDTVVEILMYHKGGLEVLFDTIVAHDNPAPSIDNLDAAGLEFHPR